jgi:hypothetical protein
LGLAGAVCVRGGDTVVLRHKVSIYVT